MARAITVAEAERHLEEAEEAYRSIGIAGRPAYLLFIKPLRDRWDAGERSQGLLKAIMELEL